MVRTTVDQVDQVCPVNGKTGMFKSVDEFTEKEEVDQAGALSWEGVSYCSD
jgi:hypothetical protein